MTINIQKALMARNIFAKYSGLHKREALKIVEATSDEFITALCAASQADAKQLVDETYAAIQVADGKAAQAKLQRAPNPKLGEIDDGVQRAEPTSGSTAGEATGGDPDSLETGGPETSEGGDEGDAA